MCEEFFTICLDMALHNILKVSDKDTHLTPADVSSLMLQFPDHEILVSGSKTNSRGVAIFLRKKLNKKYKIKYKIKYSSIDQNGILILLDLQLGEISLRLLNVYAPKIDNPFSS